MGDGAFEVAMGLRRAVDIEARHVLCDSILAETLLASAGIAATYR
jgi:hypothetical protein